MESLIKAIVILTLNKKGAVSPFFPVFIVIHDLFSVGGPQHDHYLLVCELLIYRV